MGDTSVIEVKVIPWVFSQMGVEAVQPSSSLFLVLCDWFFQRCRRTVALFFLVLCWGQPGWVAQSLLGPCVCGRMPQTRDGVPLQVRHVPACYHRAPCGVAPISHGGGGKKTKLFLTLSISCTMKNHCDLYIYTLGKFYCCLIYGIILLIPGLFNKTLYL